MAEHNPIEDLLRQLGMNAGVPGVNQFPPNILEMLLKQRQQQASGGDLKQNTVFNPTVPAQGKQGGGIGGFLDKTDAFLNKPTGRFLLNLAAQSGFSTVPQSPIGAIGRAGLAAQEGFRSDRELKGRTDLQGASTRRLDTLVGGQGLQDDLTRSMIERNQQLGAAGSNPGGNNVSSQFVTKNDAGERVIAFQRRNGPITITDIPADDFYDIRRSADGTEIAVNARNPTEIIEVLSPEEAKERSTAANVSAAERVTKEAVAREDVKDVRALPGKIEKDQIYLDDARAFVKQLESGELRTGQVQGKLTRFLPKGEAFNIFASGSVLDKLSENTFGALSENELKFLEKSTFGLGIDEQVNIDEIKKVIRIIEGAQKRAAARLARIKGDEDEFPGFSIAEQ